MRKIIYLIVLATCFYLTTGKTMAQGVTTAALNGTVVDEKGQALPGATVVAVHTPSGSQYGYSTRENGQFNLPAVRTGGPYTVTVTFIGYNKTTLNDIYLNLGQSLDLNISMKPSGVDLQEVVISGKKDQVFNSNRTGAGNVMNNRQISEIPTLSRSINDVTRLTPQGSGNGNFVGRNNLYNNLSIDGSIFNNVFGLAAQPGGQANAQPISLDAIEEVQISMAPFDVRQSGFTGAGVNAITRSGTNEVKASVYTYWRNQSMLGTKVADVSIVNNNFTQRQSGFRVGGPIIKNKLFFFVNAEMEDRVDPATTYLASRPGQDASANVATGVQASDMDLIRNTLLSKNYDPGVYENYNLGTSNKKFILRLDYNINQNNKLTVRYNYLESWREVNASGATPSVNFMAFSNTRYKIHNNIGSIVAELNSTLGKSFSNNLVAGYTQFRDYRESPSDPFPYVEIFNSGTKMTSFGYEQFTPNNKLNTDIFQLSDNFTYYLGNHTITLGGALESYKFENGFTPQFYGYFKYNSVSDFVNDATGVLGNVQGNAAQYILQYSAVKGETVPLAKLNASQLSFYVQDEFKFSKQLKVTYGIRMDMPFYPVDLPHNTILDGMTFQDPNGNPIAQDVSKLPKTTPLWSPRIGFNFDVFGDRSTQLRGGTGVFTGKIPFVWLSNQASNNGLLFNNINVIRSAATPTTAYTFSSDVNKYVVTNGSPATANLTINTTADNFKFPQVFRSNLAIDQKLPYGIVGTFEGIFTKDLNNVVHYNANLPTAAATILPDGRLRFPTTKLNSTITGDYVLNNTSDGYSYFLTAQLQKSFDFGLNVMASYTYSQTQDISSNPNAIAASALNGNPVQSSPNRPNLTYSDFDQPHKLIFNLGYKIDYLKMFSSALNVTYIGSYGSRYSYTYGGDINGDGVSNNDLIYVPKNQADINLIPVPKSTDTRTPQQIWDQLDAYISQDAYLSQHRGEIVQRNGVYAPWVNKFDVRFTQDVYFNVAGKRNTLEFTLDIINAGNLLNSSWGVAQIPTKTNFLNFVDMKGPGGTPEFSFPYLDAANKVPLASTYVNSTGLSSLWQIQFGLRYIFN